jgi:hypothetical protein
MSIRIPRLPHEIQSDKNKCEGQIQVDKNKLNTYRPRIDDVIDDRRYQNTREFLRNRIEENSNKKLELKEELSEREKYDRDPIDYLCRLIPSEIETMDEWDLRTLKDEFEKLASRGYDEAIHLGSDCDEAYTVAKNKRISHYKDTLRKEKDVLKKASKKAKPSAFNSMADKWADLAKQYKYSADSPQEAKNCEREEQIFRDKYQRFNKRKRVLMRIGIFLHICVVATYLYVLFGTDIIRIPWTAISIDFNASAFNQIVTGFDIVKHCFPLAGLALALGVVSFIFLRGSGRVSGLRYIIITIIVQMITVFVWNGYGLDHLIEFVIVGGMIMILSAIPGAILSFFQKHK